VLVRVEADTKSGLSTDAGVWIDSLNTFVPGVESVSPDAMGPGAFNPAAENARNAARFGLRSPGLPAPGAAGALDAPASKPKDPNVIDRLDVTFRAVSLPSQADANQVMAYAVENALRSSALFDPTNTALSSSLGPTEDPGTFTFKMNIQLKRPLKL
jgi:hypothetical protein